MVLGFVALHCVVSARPLMVVTLRIMTERLPSLTRIGVIDHVSYGLRPGDLGPD